MSSARRRRGRAGWASCGTCCRRADRAASASRHRSGGQRDRRLRRCRRSHHAYTPRDGIPIFRNRALGAGRSVVGARILRRAGRNGAGAARRLLARPSQGPGIAMPTVAELVQALEAIAPLDLAESWDNVGLLLGDPAADVRKVMTCLTVTPESAAEAVAEGVSLIVSHHPVLFRPTQRLTTANPEGRMLLALARAGIAVYSPHTACDNAPGGINDLLARHLELTQVTPLVATPQAAACKIAVFVPDADLAKVSDALFTAGAGRIGQYRECSFRLAGTGTFFGEDATNPTVGQKGRREEVAEWRLEAICPESLVDAAVAAMRRAHSYEEPAYDVYPLRPERGRGGAGRIGSLPSATPLTALAQRVKSVLSA